MNQPNGMQEALQKLPSVDEVLQNYSGIPYGAPHKLVVKTIRSIIQTYRNHILSGKYALDLPKSIYEKTEVEIKVNEQLEKKSDIKDSENKK